MENTEPNIAVSELRGLIGSYVRHDGARCEVVEVLEDGPAIVLHECLDHPAIQADQHGEAHRRVPSMITVPILSPDGSQLSAAFLQLDLLDERSSTG